MSRTLQFAPAAVAALLLAGPLGACREHGTPDPTIRLAISHEPEQAAGQSPAANATDETGTAGTSGTAGAAGTASNEAGKVPIPTRLEIPPMVGQIYSGIRLTWKDSNGGKSGTLDVPLGSSAQIPNSSLSVSADVYLPAFTMTSDVITTNSLDEENPAARISVTDQSEGKGKQIFAGWIFNRFPDVHPFQHPRFSLKLEGGVRKAASK